MTTFYCDIDEAGVASSTLLSGSTMTFGDTASARDSVVLTVASLLLSTAAAASSMQVERGYDSTSSGTATSTLLSTTQAVDLLVSYGTATSVLDQQQDDAFVSVGAATSALLSSRDTLIAETGAAASAATSSTARQQLVVESGRATSALIAPIENVAVAAGAAQSALLAPVTRTSLAVADGTGTSTLLADAGTSTLLTATASATSALISAGFYTDDVTEQAVGTSAVLLPVVNAAWVTNTQSMAMTRYSGLCVSSLAQVGGKILALGDGGLYEMAGMTDNGKPITPSLKTGMSMLGFPALKQLGDIIVSYVCAGTMAVKISTYSEKHQGTWTYTMPPRAADAPRANRLVVGKGLRARYFRFEYTTLDGAAFDVDTVTADVAVHNRRI